jgi:hypothetical protein
MRFCADLDESSVLHESTYAKGPLWDESHDVLTLDKTTTEKFAGSPDANTYTFDNDLSGFPMETTITYTDETLYFNGKRFAVYSLDAVPTNSDPIDYTQWKADIDMSSIEGEDTWPAGFTPSAARVHGEEDLNRSIGFSFSLVEMPNSSFETPMPD